MVRVEAGLASGGPNSPCADPEPRPSLGPLCAGPGGLVRTVLTRVPVTERVTFGRVTVFAEPPADARCIEFGRAGCA